MVNYLRNEVFNRHQAVLFTGLICAILLIGVFYLYCLGWIVMETVARNQNFQNLQIIKREYSESEKSYLAILSKLDLDYAYSLGFTAGDNLVFVSRKAQMAQVSNYAQ